jgi:MFS family permease
LISKQKREVFGPLFFYANNAEKIGHTMAKGCEMMENSVSYKKGFIPYALAALLIGLVGGFSTVLGPAFVQDIGIAYNNTTWTALAQAMSTAACAPILGKVGDVFGRRRTLLLGIAVFALGNILSALANSLIFMLLARFIVGIGTAAMAPVILAYIATEFPQDKIAKGFSLYMLLSSASVIIGPTIGGLIVSAYGWRTMLWACVAISAGIFAACVYTSRNQPSITRPLRNFDIFGAVLILIFFSLLLCIPAFGQNFGWTSAPFLIVLGAAAVSMVGLVLSQRRASHPILSGKFISRSVFILSVLALFLTQGLMQANMTNTIVFVNYTQPGNTAVSGYAISVMYIGMSLGAIILGPLADKFNPKRILIGSFLLTGLSCALLLLFTEATSVLLMASLGVLGFGLGGNATIFMKVVLSGLSPQEAGAGTGTYGLFRDLAAPFGVAVFVPLFTNRITAGIAAGAAESAAAVTSIHFLAIAEIVCVALGIAAVAFLPKPTKEN